MQQCLYTPYAYGYTTTCTYTCTIRTTPEVTYTCPNGGVTCIQNDFPQPVKKYSCSRIYTLNGDKCEQYEIKESKPVFTK